MPALVDQGTAYPVARLTAGLSCPLQLEYAWVTEMSMGAPGGGTLRR